MDNVDMLRLAVKCASPNNEIIEDNRGNLSVMVRIPKFRMSDVIDGGSDDIHPAFIVNGREIPEIYVSKYQNVMIDGLACSLPGQDPAGGMTYEEAIEACESKGDGWHLMTNAEWAAIALWCRRNGFFPKGANCFGRDCHENIYSAIPATYDSDGNIAHVLTGTGPLSWSHNNQPDGIWDMNGNICEFVAGLRTVRGEIQIIENNDAALPVDSGPASNRWRAVLADGRLTAPDTEGTMKLDYRNGRWVIADCIEMSEDAPKFCPFNEIRGEGINVPEILIALAICPADNGNHGGAVVCLNNGAEEKIFNRGAAQHSKDGGGVFFLSGNGIRSRVSPAIGLRCAYISSSYQ